MKCQRCPNEVPVRSKGYQPKFCSRACANVRDHSADTKKRIAKSMRLGIASETPEKRKERIARAVATGKANRAEMVLNGPFDMLSLRQKRERILSEQNGLCALCPNDQTWNGKPLRFELDHVSGDRSDESRSNLRLLCPNCHSQTETFCKPKTKPLDIEKIKESSSVYAGMKAQGLQTGGKQYKRVKNMLV